MLMVVSVPAMNRDRTRATRFSSPNSVSAFPRSWGGNAPYQHDPNPPCTSDL